MSVSYTRKYIPAMIELFGKAREILWNGVKPEDARSEQFICHALEAAHRETNPEMYDVESMAYFYAKELVEESLYPYGTLETWLESKGYGLKLITDDKAMQALRREWIDNIIADLKRFANDAG